jgi:hypothetical protein
MFLLFGDDVSFGEDIFFVCIYLNLNALVIEIMFQNSLIYAPFVLM